MSRGLSLSTCQMRHEADPESTEKTECDGTEAKMQQGNLSRNQSADKLKGRIQMQQKTHSVSHKTGGGKAKRNLIHQDIFELLPTQMLSTVHRCRWSNPQVSKRSESSFSFDLFGLF